MKLGEVIQNNHCFCTEMAEKFVCQVCAGWDNVWVFQGSD